MNCPKCDFKNRDEAMFCIKCGESVAVKCISCGNLIFISANYCDKCGRSRKITEDVRNETDILFGQLQFSKMPLKEARNLFEKCYLEKKLEEFGWNISKVAEVIGIERSNLHRKINFYNLKNPFSK